jgi:hypothetical protein
MNRITAITIANSTFPTDPVAAEALAIKIEAALNEKDAIAQDPELGIVRTFASKLHDGPVKSGVITILDTEARIAELLIKIPATADLVERGRLMDELKRLRILRSSQIKPQ